MNEVVQQPFSTPADQPAGQDGYRPDLISYEAETLVLAACLQRNSAYDHIADMLGPEHFGDDFNAQVFNVIQQLLQEGDGASAVTVYHRFGGEAYFGDNDAEAREYLASLQASQVTTITVRSHAHVLVDLAEKRRLLRSADDVLVRLTEEGDYTATEIADGLLSSLMEVQGQHQEAGQRSLAQVMNETVADIDAVYKAGGGLRGITTGLTDLNRRTGGLVAPNVIVLGGRPSMGKTALALTLAKNGCQTGARGLFFSLEMAAEEIGARLLSEVAGVPYSRLHRGGQSADEHLRLCDRRYDFNDLALQIDDRSQLSVQQMHVAARRMKRRDGLDFIVIDHLGYVIPPDHRAARHKQLGDIMKAVRGMAKALDVPVLVLCQLARVSVQSDERRPELHHLRESGQIEEDADAVWFIHREAYYLERQNPSDPEKRDQVQQKLARVQNTAEVIVAKQRQGPIGTVNVYADMATNVMRDLAQDEEAHADG